MQIRILCILNGQQRIDDIQLSWLPDGFYYRNDRTSSTALKFREESAKIKNQNRPPCAGAKMSIATCIGGARQQQKVDFFPSCAWKWPKFIGLIQFYDYVVRSASSRINLCHRTAHFTTSHFNLFMCRFYILAIC